MCLDLAYSKISLTTWKNTSKANVLVIFPIAKAGRLADNVDDEWKFELILIGIKVFKTTIIQIQVKFGRYKYKEAYLS